MPDRNPTGKIQKFMLRILENIREGSETGSDLKPTEVGYGSAYGSEKITPNP